MKKFSEFNLPKKLHQSLAAMGFETPTPIQEQTITFALEGKDIVGTAQTGTGKTGAFTIPLVAKLIENPEETVLVLTPTRELAMQVTKVFHQALPKDRSVRTALLIGGDSMEKQLRDLKRNPRVLVGTPGRINDHLKRGSMKVSNTRSLVLDETDQMLDMGFDVQIDAIIKKMPEDRQTLMFSATLPKKLEKLAGQYLKDPVRVSVGKHSEPAKDVEQRVLNLTHDEKYPELITQLEERQGSIIIFVKTKRDADKIAEKLSKDHHPSHAIHGDLRQNKRERILNNFRKEKYRILVATDVAARGIDIPHIRHVINYDLPQQAENYIHRIGRTARAGEKGHAISFVTVENRGKWYAIERLLDPTKKRQGPKKDRKNFSKRKKPSRKAYGTAPNAAPNTGPRKKKAYGTAPNPGPRKKKDTRNQTPRPAPNKQKKPRRPQRKKVS